MVKYGGQAAMNSLYVKENVISTPCSGTSSITPHDKLHGTTQGKTGRGIEKNVYCAPEIILQLTLIQTNRTPVAPPARTTSSQSRPTGKQQEPTKTTMSEEEIMAKAIALSMAEAEEKKKKQVRIRSRLSKLELKQF